MPNVLTRSGSGYIDSFAGGTTIANCVITTDADVDVMWKPTGIQLQSTTSATVGNRQFKIHIADAAGGTISDLIFVTTLAASKTGYFSWYVGAPVTGTNLTVGTQVFATFPLPDMILPPGTTITASDVAAVDNADVATINMLYNLMEPIPQ